MWFDVALFVANPLVWYQYHRLWDSSDSTPQPRPPVLQVPQVQEGALIPLIYGTVRVRTPIMVWSGNYLAPGQDYRWEASTRGDVLGHGGGQAGNAQSENYSFDGLWVVGVPFYGKKDFGLTVFNGARLRRGWIGDSELSGIPGDPFTGGDPNDASVPGSLSQKFGFVGQGIANAGRFEPDSSVLSLTGVMYLGTETQDVIDAALADGPSNTAYWDGKRTGDTSFRAALLNAPESLSATPGYRSQIVVYAHVGLAGSSSVPSISFEMTSVAFNSASDFGHSGEVPILQGIVLPVLPIDEDPVAVIYDLLTSRWGKLSLPAEKVDRLSFQRASDVLFAEGNRCSMLIDQGTDASAIIDSVLRQIDGVLYPEPTTGKLVIRLVRADYDVATLRDINPSNARPADASWYTIQGWSELPTQVRVKWTDRSSGYADAVSVAQNGAAAVAQARTLRSVTKEYPGCCSPVLAAKLASRELAAASMPIAKVSMFVDRSFHNARPGDVFTWTWPELEIDHMVMRVAGVDLGRLNDGKITLTMLRDAFDVSLGAFGSGSGSGSGSGGQHV